MKFLITLFFIFGHGAYALNSAIEIKGGITQANNNEGEYFEARAQQSLNKEVTIGFFSQYTNRVFNKTVNIDDFQYGLSGSYKASKKNYIEFRSSFSSKAVFFPKLSLQIQPHIILANIDFWVGFKKAFYKDSDIWEYRLGLLKETSFNLLAGAQIFYVDTNSSALSYHLFGKYSFKKFELRVDLSKGKALEAQNLIGRFESAGLEFIAKSKYLNYGLAASFYSGNVRNENRYYLILKKDF